MSKSRRVFSWILVALLIGPLWMQVLMPKAWAVSFGMVQALINARLESLGITSGGEYTASGGDQTLAEVLAEGATTGGTDLTVTAGDSITGSEIGTWDNTGLVVAAGSKASPSVRFGDDDSGIYGSAGEIRISSNDALRFRVGYSLVAYGNFDIEGDMSLDNNSVHTSIGAVATATLLGSSSGVISLDHATGIGPCTLVMGNGATRHKSYTSTLTDGSATEVLAIQSTLGDAGCVKITYSIIVTTATGVQQSEQGTVQFATLDGAGGVSASSAGEVSVQALEDGTLTSAWTIDDTDDGDLEISVNADSSLTVTSMVCRWYAVCSGDVTLVVP